MLRSSNAHAAPVKAKLLVDMVYNKERRSAGEVIEMPAREFHALKYLNRVEEAPAGKK